MPEMEDTLRTGIISREDGDKEVLLNIREKLSQISNEIQEEKKLREDSELKHFDMIKSFVDSVRQDIQDEKTDREKSEESILAALEQTCIKLADLSRI